MMALIRISKVKPGQVVAVDVKDRSGRILLKADSVLTEENIKIIKSWGVVEIDVNGDLAEAALDDEMMTVQPEELQQIELGLSQRFRFLNRSHPFIGELYEICLERRLKERGLTNG